MPYEYQFPIYTKTKVSIGSQIEKIMEETEEVRTAPYLHEVIKETFDVIQAAETLLRKCDPEEVQQAFEEVVQGNQKRGYYDCEKSSLKSRSSAGSNLWASTDLEQRPIRCL